MVKFPQSMELHYSSLVNHTPANQTHRVQAGGCGLPDPEWALPQRRGGGLGIGAPFHNSRGINVHAHGTLGTCLWEASMGTLSIRCTQGPPNTGERQEAGPGAGKVGAAPRRSGSPNSAEAPAVSLPDLLLIQCRF